jgi:MarR family transcriptional regulator, transcriptional regulator for hemolysin
MSLYLRAFIPLARAGRNDPNTSGHAKRDAEAYEGCLAYQFARPYNEKMPNTDDYIGVVISDVARLLRTEFDRRVRKLGITRSQWLVLTRLHRNPGASHSELADMLEVEKPTAGRMIDRLEANGWVERRSEKDDRRIKRVYLTAEAERVHKRIWRVAESTVEDALADLTAEEGRQLMSLPLRVKNTMVSGAGDVRPRRRGPVVGRSLRRVRGHVRAPA